MIAASEPLEFVPSGRLAVEEHPGDCKQNANLPTEHVLLLRMQHVNISDASEEPHNEFWSMREIYKGCTDEYVNEYLVNTEEELYVKKQTAVWTKGVAKEHRVLSRLCFTCESPIKFAFFCSNDFVAAPRATQQRHEDNVDASEQTSICLIDQNSIRVYCSGGEDFLTSLEFPVSHVWPTKCGLLLEKEPSNAVIEHHSIPMPRLFSLAHPLDEISPVLNKLTSNHVGYHTESEYDIKYSEDHTDLLLIYDNKIKKHFIARVRKASVDEIQCVSAQNETAASVSGIHRSLHRGSGIGTTATGNSANFSHSSLRVPGSMPKNSTTHFGRHNMGNANYTLHISKLLSSGASFSGSFGSLRNTTTTALQHLQSTIGPHSLSVHDMRRLGESQPSKPIVPQLCLEHIWTEGQRDMNEAATRVFLHTDLVGQTFLCYLLGRACKLQMVRLIDFGQAELQIAAMPASITAKDALPLQHMKMLAVLDPVGSLLLYTGNVLVTKVHIAPIALCATPANVTHASPNLSFPRRSSLLPMTQKSTVVNFEEEIHFLSPVHPLQPQFPNRNVNSVCLGLRDGVCNRLTLVFPGTRMFRISLPFFSDTQLVSRCIMALRQLLNREQFLQMITRWYSARNPPGSTDYSIAQEWAVFRSVLLELLGCTMATQDDVAAGAGNVSGGSFNAGEPKKRRKNEELGAGTDADWEFMLSLVQDDTCGTRVTLPESERTHPRVNTSAPLFSAMPAIFYGFHLLYEDLKLSPTMHDFLPPLAKLLHQLAVDMQLHSYTYHYALDYPVFLRSKEKLFPLTEKHGAQMHHQALLHMPAPGVYEQLVHIMCGQEVASPYHYVEGINDLSRNILQLTSLVVHGHLKIKQWIKPLAFDNSVQSFYAKRPKRFIATNVPHVQQVIQMIINMGLTRRDIEHLPVALHLILAECLEAARLSPPIGSSSATYELILRSELAAHARLSAELSKSAHRTHIDVDDALSARCPPTTSGIAHMDTTLDDGMDNIDTKLLSLRFPDDMRITEVRRLLTSSEAVLIDIVQSPGTSDHEFIEEQEKQLFALCTRTMTLPMGRGMFTMRTSIPTPTESMPIPKLCLTGREPQKGAAIDMQQIEFPPSMSLWPTFHNGVAAGLKISPQARDVDSTWIVYNKPKGLIDISAEHAGFLMALGLNGHLKTLSFMSIYEYLVKCDDITSVGLLLGISATHWGTMDNNATKLLSVHIEAMLPATALELDIPQNTQVACLMGIGLVFAGTAKRHIAEVLMHEVGRPPGPEMENSIERESYALTAGLALGLVTLGQGESPAGLRDLQLPDTLHYYMVGGTKRPLTGSQKEKFKLPSFQVREGDNVNIDVTAPGATLGLGLMFFNTGNRAVAEWMEPPNTRYLLNLVRPDLLLLRTIARGLILWQEVQASEAWLFNQFPANLRFDIERGSAAHHSADNVDHEAITQAYCNIIGGAAFCMGLKYAGTENPQAFKTLRRVIKLFLGFPGKYVGEFAGRTTIESSLMLILLAISLVYAGSGDLEILRIIRYLRSRIGPLHSQVTYGSHMAIHMSLGFLFLGAGRFTLAKTPEAIAALVCALFPKFPNHSTDNRYHLQAFRHLYVLAVEPRLFLPRDIDSKKLCLCNISVLELGGVEMRALPMAPCILPELSTLEKMLVDDPNYWPVCFERGRNWHQLIKILANSACIDIKKRSGCLSHIDDPDRLKSLLAQTLTTEQYLCWEIDPKALERFSNEPYVIGITDRFLHFDAMSDASEIELTKKQLLTMLFYNAVIKDKMHALSVYWSIFDTIARIKRQPKSTDIWQIRLLELYLERYGSEAALLFSGELLQSLVEQFKDYIEITLHAFGEQLKQFVTLADIDEHMFGHMSELDMARLSAVIRYYNLTPNLARLADFSDGGGGINFLKCLVQFKKLNMPTHTIHGLMKIIMQKSA